MKNDFQDQRNSYIEFNKQLSAAMTSNAFIFRFIGTGILVMLIPGILFACILFGLFYGFAKIALVSDSAYQLFRKLLGLQDMPSFLPKPPLWQIVYNCASLVFPAFFIYVGVSGFSSIRFCSQSVVCSLMNLIYRLL